jgi:hypothetical protein
MNPVVLFDNLLESLPSNKNEIVEYYQCITVSDCTIFMLKHYLTTSKDLILTSDEKRKYIYDKLLAYAMIRSMQYYNDELFNQTFDSTIDHKTYTEEEWLNNISNVSEYYTGNDGYVIYFIADIALKEIFSLLK